MDLEQNAEFRHQSLMREAQEERAVDEVLEARRLAERRSDKHRDHLCYLAEMHQLDRVAKLIGDGGYMCGFCGRVAASEDNLCEPRPRER